MKPTPQAPSPSTLVSNGILSACNDLNLPGKVVARILGISEATASRLRKGTWKLQEGSKAYELALALLRIHHALKSKMGDNRERMRAWLRERNVALGGVPMELLDRIQGLFGVLFLLERKEAN